MNIIELLGVIILLVGGTYVVVTTFLSNRRSIKKSSKIKNSVQFNTTEQIKVDKKPRTLDEDLVEGDGPADLLDPITPLDINENL